MRLAARPARPAIDGPPRTLGRDDQTASPRTIWAVALAASALFFVLALLRHLSFHSAGYDLGFFDQVLWNASHGHGFRSTFIPYGFFGEHFEPVLLLFLPFYRLAPSPLWLLGAQALALGLAAVPLHAVARRLLGPSAAWIAVAAYLLQLGVARAVESDFHPETLAVPFVFLAFGFALQRRWGWFVLCAIIPLLTKEDAALVAIGVGIIAILMTRTLIGLIPAVAGLAYGSLVLFWVMPALRHGAAGDLVLRYAYLGSTPGQVALAALTRPWLWIGHLLTSPALPALLVLLIAVGLLPVLRPATMVAALLPLLPAVLSSDAYQEGLRLQYAIPAVPLLMVAALLGWQRLPALPSGAILLLGAGVTSLWLAPILPRLGTDLPGLARVPAVDRILASIPAGEEVAASSGLVPQLSERPNIWEFPAGFGSRWVVIDQATRPSQQSLQHGYAGAVARLASAGYELEGQAGGVALWRRSP